MSPTQHAVLILVTAILAASLAYAVASRRGVRGFE